MPISNPNPERVAMERQVDNKTPERMQPQRDPSANRRFGAIRLSVGGLIAGLAVAASLITFGESWITLFVFLVAAVYVWSEVLVFQLPVSITSAMKRNCIRRDGSWSQKREKIERFAIEKFRWDIRIILLLVLVPTTILTYLVDQTIIPVRIGFSGLTSLRVSPVETRSNLVDEEQAFDKWAAGNLFRADTEKHKRVLWYFWPIVVLAALFWIFGCWVAIQRTYSSQLKELYEKITRRGVEYIKFDDANAF